MHWLYSAYVTIGGHQITYREIIGNLFGFASAIGGMRRRVWAWPVGIVGNVLLFTVFVGTAVGAAKHGPLLGQAGRQVFFAATSVYGWHRWRQSRRSDLPKAPAVSPRWATAKERGAYLALAAAAVAVCYVVFRAIGAGFPAQWWYYLADSWIFVGSMVATFAMARGWVDFWLCWIAVDAVGVPELIHFQFYPTAVMFLIYGLFVIWGFGVWFRIARLESQPAAVAQLQEAAS